MNSKIAISADFEPKIDHFLRLSTNFFEVSGGTGNDDVQDSWGSPFYAQPQPDYTG